MNHPRPHHVPDTAAILGWDFIALLIVGGGVLTGMWLNCWGAAL
ncbi:hypothetical protein ACFXG4_27390 [Nocardia sp. NPDC059246]